MNKKQEKKKKKIIKYMSVEHVDGVASVYLLPSENGITVCECVSARAAKFNEMNEEEN